MRFYARLIHSSARRASCQIPPPQVIGYHLNSHPYLQSLINRSVFLRLSYISRSRFPRVLCVSPNRFLSGWTHENDDPHGRRKIYLNFRSAIAKGDAVSATKHYADLAAYNFVMKSSDLRSLLTLNWRKYAIHLSEHFYPSRPIRTAINELMSQDGMWESFDLRLFVGLADYKNDPKLMYDLYKEMRKQHMMPTRAAIFEKMFRCLERNDCLDEAFEVLKDMTARQFNPPHYTVERALTRLLEIVGQGGEAFHKAVWSYKHAKEVNVIFSSTYYKKFIRTVAARYPLLAKRALEDMVSDRNEPSQGDYDEVLNNLVRRKCNPESVSVYKEMREKKMMPSKSSFTHLLDVVGRFGNTEVLNLVYRDLMEIYYKNEVDDDGKLLLDDIRKLILDMEKNEEDVMKHVYDHHKQVKKYPLSLVPVFQSLFVKGEDKKVYSKLVNLIENGYIIHSDLSHYIIAQFVWRGQLPFAESLLLSFPRFITPPRYTYSMVANAFIQQNNHPKAERILHEMIGAGHTIDHLILCEMIKKYTRVRDTSPIKYLIKLLEDARTKQMDYTSASVLLEVYSTQGDIDKASEIWNILYTKYNDRSLNAALSMMLDTIRSHGDLKSLKELWSIVVREKKIVLSSANYHSYIKTLIRFNLVNEAIDALTIDMSYESITPAIGTVDRVLRALDHPSRRSVKVWEMVRDRWPRIEREWQAAKHHNMGIVDVEMRKPPKKAAVFNEDNARKKYESEDYVNGNYIRTLNRRMDRLSDRNDVRRRDSEWEDESLRKDVEGTSRRDYGHARVERERTGRRNDWDDDMRVNKDTERNERGHYREEDRRIRKDVERTDDIQQIADSQDIILADIQARPKEKMLYRQNRQRI
ncbi:4431_t:CDS:2 [Paraglomus brasilianum]|uniref:4431_t:CDS:1 n=1 Tax=Paraglomus brasilianum TaxID=144538 RepID=A0A9N9G1W8_9GLOM|nr:4431_t:CDS:2 [Paraglomus brasilianum]